MWGDGHHEGKIFYDEEITKNSSQALKISQIELKKFKGNIEGKKQVGRQDKIKDEYKNIKSTPNKKTSHPH